MKEVERIKGFSFKHDNLLKVSEFTEQIPESALLGFLNTLNGARSAPPPPPIAAPSITAFDTA